MARKKKSNAKKPSPWTVLEDGSEHFYNKTSKFSYRRYKDCNDTEWVCEWWYGDFSDRPNNPTEVRKPNRGWTKRWIYLEAKKNAEEWQESAMKAMYKKYCDLGK